VSVKAPPRERLLRAAAELFYAEGVTTVGVERLCRAAGVSKRSMYQLFETKDELVAESLREFGGREVATYFEPADAHPTPRGRILHVFHRLEQQAGSPGFHGCPFVNTAVELHDAEHPASAVARRFKRQLTVYFEQQARLGGARDPQTLAAQLTIVFDGCAVRAVMLAAGLDGVAIQTATTLLDAAGVATGNSGGGDA
jgi:AcrR family transcriptional regulator